jgi:hypothetical protein
MRASLPQWYRESPWLAFNRCISREEWTRPTDAWIAQHRYPANCVNRIRAGHSLDEESSGGPLN